jgi:two-component system response regulator MtrA
MSNVLVVEDDVMTREATILLLSDSGMSAVGVATGSEALAMLEPPSEIDLVVLDLGLPDTSGFDVCQRVRERSSVPLVILSGRAEQHDIVVGLDLGADDYVTKPFGAAEFVARVRAAMRRRSVVVPLRIEIAELTIDGARHRAVLGDAELDLTPVEFRLLSELASHPGEVLTREVLVERVWGFDYLGNSRLVDMAVQRVRHKLGDDAREPRYVSTVRGIGYRFEPGSNGSPAD